ncbi:Type 1 glutamine amidotransferase-like domain-containing protein [Nocardioides sp. SYSU DS0663]|uniref:Type 1 glutamine amidotransferase-like domain-containing protein n=1 Tax=Nocardioides sp. SYSU DS0663 TaxID=3416445 RepID=UPI003F4C2472
MTVTILAMGGGGFSMEPDNPLLDDFALSLATRRRGAGGLPRVCFVPTASGDSETYQDQFREAFTGRAEVSTLSLFRLGEVPGGDVREHVLAQDVVYVGGGSTANLLALWRLHGLDEVLREAAEAGTVLAGVSAGMNCWFEASVTDSFGPMAPLTDGLGLLTGSACPHYDGEPERRPTYLDLVGTKRLPSGYAADDGCALLFRGGELVEAVASRPEARAYRVHLSGDALDVEDGMEAPDVAESPVEVRFLG